MIDFSDVVGEFLVESHENLDRLDSDLVALEERSGDRELLDRVFRTIHTIKGTCGFLGFSKLESVTHVGENLLCCLRDGEIRADPMVTTSLLALVDAVRQILRAIETQGNEGEADWTALVDTLSRLTGSSVKPIPEEVASDIEPADPTLPAPAAAGQRGGGGSVVDNNIRVDVQLLDRLMNLVGELVLARNQILQCSVAREDASFVAASQRLNLITSELQEGVMKTRMQPIDNVWSRFPRMIRDLALACGKRVRVEMEGRETELDKTIVEAIKDPLTHVIRNAVDHGIERPEERVRTGKGAEGRVCLRAYHEGGQVNIEVTDDGAGITADRVREKALRRGLVPPEQLARMTDREVINLIFLPGFSTAEAVTNVSGRGVGMDVVKTNIEKIGGSVDVSTRPGQGTTLKMKIPLTLAIIPALIVTSGGERFAIPQASLLELVRLEAAQARRHIQSLHGAPVYRLRGNLLPLVYLNEELALGASAGDPVDTDEPVSIVVLQADGRTFGLVVDHINDTQEIVVKPLGKQIKGLSCFAGATIMGDGRVALILDVLGIAQGAGVVSELRKRKLDEAGTGPEAENTNRVALLLFGVEGGRRMAIPLAHVARLEEFPVTALEHAGRHEVVQYRNNLLPLLRVSRFVGAGHGAPDADPLHVVVCSELGRSVGLVVDEIIDIVDEPLDIQCSLSAAEGVLGAAVIQRRVTDLLDVRALFGHADPGLFRGDDGRAGV